MTKRKLLDQNIVTKDTPHRHCRLSRNSEARKERRELQEEYRSYSAACQAHRISIINLEKEEDVRGTHQKGRNRGKEEVLNTEKERNQKECGLVRV